MRIISAGENIARAMATCLPNTHLNYKREEISPIGSIKNLQIQWGNTNQRKQVSRKVIEKQGEKISREGHDKQDSLQHQNKKRKTEKTFKLHETCLYASKNDSDHFERSDLSEEHDPPAFVLNKCNSHKGTQDSNNNNAVKDFDPNKKRPGMVIRIKLPSKKPKDLKPESASIDPSCSSRVTESFQAQAFLTDSAPSSSPQAHPSQVVSVSIESARAPRCPSQVTKPPKAKPVLTDSTLRTKELPSANQLKSIAEPCLSYPAAKPPVLQKVSVEANPSESKHKRPCSQRSERQVFRDLIMNLKPPPIQPVEADEGELDWLFAPKKSQDARKPSAQILKKNVSVTTTITISSSFLQPKATYLPELNMYEQPYVIPF